MANLTAPLENNQKVGDIVSYYMGAVKIYKGALVSMRLADGYVYPARSGTATDVFMGVADETVDNSGGAAGALRIRVRKSGSYIYGKAAAVQTDLALPFYASDDNNVTATSTSNQLVGYPTDVISGTQLRIRIDNAVK